jgi:Tol biopolymer transport system component
MLTAGTRLGAYEIQSALGAGGMGEVYRARDVRLGRDVAIKVLPAIFGSDPERVARFEREARLLATLNHPNIAAIHGVEEHQGMWALVLELVDGDTLADRIARGPVAAPEVRRIADQLIDALDAAHERGIVHRDLKPANVKLTSNGTIKVLDFGLAKAVTDPGTASDPALSPTVTSGGTRDGIILGTAAYMSPEQARGKAVDKRADIWAFGCVLFELLAGRRPFDGESTSDVIVSVLEREPPWSALPLETPPALRGLIGRCLEKDPKARLRDIADARAELQQDVAVQPAATRRGGRSAALAFAALGALAALLAAEGWSRWQTPRVPEFYRATRIVATAAHEYGPAISPDGKWIAYLASDGGNSDIWVKFLAGGTPRNLTAAAGLAIQALDYVASPQISPAGDFISFSAAPRGADATQYASWVIPAPGGGTPRRILDRGQQGLTWSPDGTQIAYMAVGGSAGDTVWVANSDGQQPRQIVAAHGARHTHAIRWSHDGRFVYFSYGPQGFNSEPTEIFRVPASGGALEPVVRSSRRAIAPFADPGGRGLFYAANPDTVEAGLWWRDLATGRDHRLINGVGEYGFPSVSSDGRRLVATVSTTQSYLARVDLASTGDATLTPLSDPMSGDLDPSWSADGTRLTFSSTRAGDRHIWMANADLRNPVQLTFGTAIDERPAFSPDGTEIAFVSDRDGRRGIWLVTLDGRAPRLLAVADVLDKISWSRDGRWLACAVASGARPNLVLIARESGQVRPLTVPGAATVPMWSPRADVIAYLETVPGGGAELRFIDATGSPVAFPLPPEATKVRGNLELGWAPDGRRLARVAVPGTQPGVIWIIDPTPGATRQIVRLPPATQLRGVSWTRDGSALTVGVMSRTGDIILADRKE